MNRTSRMLAVVFAALVLASFVLSGCGGASGGGEPHQGTPTPLSVRIGTLPTEDSLPLWQAEAKGYFATQGIPKVEIVEFQSAQERDAAFAAGAIDGYMGDIIAAANLQAAGKANTIETVMLGANQGQGRFGIAVNDANITEPKQLANVPVGTSSATIQEYVLDKLLAEAGVATSAVKVEEVKKVPVRFQLLMSKKLRAAALPEPFLSLASQGGATIVADDTKAKANLSQTVLVFSNAFIGKPGGKEAVTGVLKAWDQGVDDINQSGTLAQQLLAEKAKLPKSLQTSYVVNEYPKHQLPSKADVDAVLTWMKAKGYLKGDVTYEQLTGLASK